MAGKHRQGGEPTSPDGLRSSPNLAPAPSPSPPRPSCSVLSPLPPPPPPPPMCPCCRCHLPFVPSSKL
ncbi:hypothetical protein ALC57_10096 [Trachymyrmex cornetzi]|uniref:Uncharacterized protein n=1 Tax=Trachymyrmex cornetzi TaxID=471704 RepID=A0A195DYE7_9HYME|nr:hypothetical protein ALC57_10096 [Trachymyrmex cornetzi]